MSARILLADDDSSLRFVLSQALSKEGYDVRATGNVATLSKWVRDGEGDLVLSDVYMGDACVFDELPLMRVARPNLPIIVMSAQSTVTTALSANSTGAYDYMPKPFDLDELMNAIKRALESKPDAKARAGAVKAERDERLPLAGRSLAMQEVFRIVARVATSDLTVLIEGEAGVGKERVARAIHDHSRRARAPFERLSVGSLAPAALDTLLVQAANAARGGTLLLKDVDGLPLESQLRLAAFLDKMAGDIRIIAGVQKSLAALAMRNAFRHDLLHALSVVCIQLPPLRDRKEDIPELANALLVRAKKEGLGDKALDKAALTWLSEHTFPGNVRQLDNLLRRALVLSPGRMITERDLFQEPQADGGANGGAGEGFAQAISGRVAEIFVRAGPSLPEAGLYDRLLAELERPLIVQTLQATRGNQIKAAAVLGLNRNTLRKKIQALGIPTGRGD
jgi:two-component system, NtrC family, nitrogen regulation response regulator GlnG